MNKLQARRLAALLTERQKQDLLLLAEILNERYPAEEAGEIWKRMN